MQDLNKDKKRPNCFLLSIERGGGDYLIKVGTDVRARALGISGVNFCPDIRFWEANFAWANLLAFGNF